MARRNGRGPNQVQDVTEKFRKGEQKLLKLLEEEGLITLREKEHLLAQVAEAASNKRSSEVLGAAHTVHNKIIQVLRRGKAPAEARERVELEVLYEIARLTQSDEQRERLFERFLDLTRQAIPYQNATLFLIQGDPKQLTIAASHGEVVDLIGGVKFEMGFGFSSWVAKMRNPILLSELHRGPQDNGLIVASFLSVPLIVHGELIGVINMSHARPRAFNEEHLRLLILIAGQGASVLQRLLMYEQMERLAITDDLTGLANRRHFLQHLQAEIERARRYETPFSVATLDIDAFKAINDTYGHEVGDRVLADMGRLLRKIARSSDLPARMGGEEFVFLMPMTNATQAMLGAERLRAAVEEHIFPRRKKLTVSVGVATFPADATNAQEILRKADLAMYEAKRAGRNRAVSAGPVEKIA